MLPCGLAMPTITNEHILSAAPVIRMVEASSKAWCQILQRRASAVHSDRGCGGWEVWFPPEWQHPDACATHPTCLATATPLPWEKANKAGLYMYLLHAGNLALSGHLPHGLPHETCPHQAVANCRPSCLASCHCRTCTALVACRSCI